MKKRKGQIDWEIAESDEAWQASQALSPIGSPTVTPSTTRHGRIAAPATVIALLLLLFVMGRNWNEQAATKKPAIVPVPTAFTEQATLTRTLELLDQQVQVTNVQAHSQRVMAQVIVNYPEGGKPRAYRETRFYTIDRDGWRQVDPDPTLIGPLKTLQVANFTILYQEPDAGAVYEVVPKLEALYARLRQDMALPRADATSTYTIKVATTWLPDTNRYLSTPRKISVASPLLLSAPAEISDATLLYQQMIYPLASMLLQESVGQHTPLWQSTFARWHPIELSLPLWEVWQADGPLAASQGEFVSWLYENGKAGAIRRQVPNDDDLICRTYFIWHLTPSEFALPLPCASGQWSQLTPGPYPTLASTWLQQADSLGKRTTPLGSFHSVAVTDETIIAYIVAVYGRDKVPELVNALGEYASVEELIPALFGLSASDFEAGWQAYLAESY